jgi:TPR repeat protein
VEKDGTWIEVQSSSFVVMTDAGADAARRTASRFEKVRAAFSAVMPRTATGLRPAALAKDASPSRHFVLGGAGQSGDRELLVVAARNEKSLRSLVPEWWEKKDGTRPSTVHLTGRDHVFLLVRTDLREGDDDSYHAAYWGYASHLIALNAPDLPLWASRGLAAFYAHTTVQKDRVLVGRAAGSHVRTLRERGLMPVSALWVVDRESPEYLDRHHLRRFDAQSWALVHYLMLGDEGAHRRKLTSFLGLLSQGQTPAAAAREALGDPEALGRALASYVRSTAYYMETIETEADRETTTLRPRPLSSAEALTLRAAVHLAAERYSDAHAGLEKALRRDPQLAWAHEIRAALAWAEDDPLVAREAAGKALALEPDRPVALRVRERAAGPPTVGGAERLCAGGDLQACVTLGGWLIDGKGTTEDPPRGVEVMDRACGGGFAEACLQLSWRYRQGHGLAADGARAVAFLEKACGAGDGRACLAAASDHQTGKGVAANPAAAARMLESACTYGEKKGCLALAWVLQSGEGVPRDLERAAALYEDGCLDGAGEACTRLGLLYVAQDGLPTDLRRAEDLLTRACELGDALGCSSLESLRQAAAPRP